MATVTAAQWQNAAHTMLKATIDGQVWSGVTAASPMWLDVQNSGVQIQTESAPSAPAVVAAIRDEAENRIETGTTINGAVFRCDVVSLTRLQGMVRAAERAEALNEPYSVTFRTAAGVEVTVNSVEVAAALESAAADYVAAVLTKSAALQATVAAMTAEQRAAFNAADNSHWD